MLWTNGSLTLYHGTDDRSASMIIKSRINLGLSNPLTDFGKGFYTTTSLHQATNWANNSYRRIPARLRSSNSAAILQFDVDGDTP